MTGWRSSGGVEVKDYGDQGVMVKQTASGGRWMHLTQEEWAGLRRLACNDPKPSLRTKEDHDV